MKLRCRLGLHRWTRLKVDDATVEPAEQRWVTRCRDCGKTKRLWGKIGMGTGQ